MRVRSVLLPSFAVVLAVATIAGWAAGWLFATVAVAAPIAVAATATARRSGARIALVLGLTALWLVVGLLGAWLLRSRPVLGLAWTLGVLFVLPLPFIPWLYARTFRNSAS